MSSLTGEVKDPIGTLVTHLLSLSDLTDLVDKRIFGGATPAGSGDFDSWITVRPAGGRQEMYQEVIAKPRIEIRTYGLTDEVAMQIYWRVYRLVNGKLNILANDARILSIWASSAGALLYDQTFNRSFVVSFYESIVQLEALSA